MNQPLKIQMPTKLYIGGDWRDASDNGTFDVINPANEQVIAKVASATVDDARSALDAADAAFADWASRKPRERAEILRKAFELISAERESFARLMTLENGKALPDSRGEAAYAAEFFRWFAEEAVRNIGEIMRSPTTGARIFVHHKPAGIAVLVTPWNFPAAMATRKIGPALAAGCPVIVKPASATPLTMLALMPLLEAAGVPKGAGERHPVAEIRRRRRRAAQRHAGSRDLVHRLDRGRTHAVEICGRQHRQSGDGTRRQCAVHRLQGCRHRRRG